MYYGKLIPYQTSWDGRWGYVDEDDNIVIQPIFDEVFEFDGLYANAILRGDLVVVDRDGNWRPWGENDSEDDE